VNLSAGFRREPPLDPATIGEDAALAARIRDEIAAGGPMTFARFMELALYDPDGGYYRAAAPRPGREGDFLTAPEAHPIFGHVLGRQLAEAWEALGRPLPFVVREHGAGTGALAEAVLRGLATDRSPLLAAIRYQAFEIDERRVVEFTERLGAAGFGNLVEPADARPVAGAVVANEVLDALPVHRIGMHDGRLLERHVDLDGDELVDAWAAPSTTALAERLADDGITLAEGQAAEVCLGLDGWVSGAVAGLQRGLLLVVDYGATAIELYDPARRPHGTLRAYVRHRVHDDVYRHVGRQDLTAHVDLTALERSMLAAGLTMIGSTTQAEFLIGSGVEELLRAVQADPATTMTAYVELRSALMRLLDPAAMGGFRVVAAGRAWPAGAALSGFAFRGPGRGRADRPY
jgi:SAM-dependent MidA family methyltransferase